MLRIRLRMVRLLQILQTWRRYILSKRRESLAPLLDLSMSAVVISNTERSINLRNTRKMLLKAIKMFSPIIKKLIYQTWRLQYEKFYRKLFLFLGAFAELRKATISFFTSVSPHGTTRLPLDGFWWNLIFELFSKLFHENSSFIKIRQEQRVLYMKTFSHLWQYLAKFFLEWEIF
jgi:hypothetical protein